MSAEIHFNPSSLVSEVFNADILSSPIDGGEQIDISQASLVQHEVEQSSSVSGIVTRCNGLLRALR